VVGPPVDSCANSASASVAEGRRQLLGNLRNGRRDKRTCIWVYQRLCLPSSIYFTNKSQEGIDETTSKTVTRKSRYSHKTMNIVLKLATPEDQVFLADLYNDVRSVDFVSLGLPEPTLAQLLAMQFQAQQIGYATQFPHAVDQILWNGTTRIGRMLVNESESEIWLVDIGILSAYRGQGLGGHFLQELCVRATAAQLPLRLSVRFNNPAQRLYERLGFVRTGGDGMYIAMELHAQKSIDETGRSQFGSAATEGERLEQGFTGAYFRTLIGCRMKAQSLDGAVADLLVEDVKGLLLPKSGPALDPGDSFVVYFRGPLTPAFPDACADLTPEHGEAMTIFLVPIERDAQGTKYEAVFNRMVPRT
jgi:GNAT superfamily N-acetyltransferase